MCTEKVWCPDKEVLEQKFTRSTFLLLGTGNHSTRGVGRDAEVGKLKVCQQKVGCEGEEEEEY